MQQHFPKGDLSHLQALHFLVLCLNGIMPLKLNCLLGVSMDSRSREEASANTTGFRVPPLFASVLAQCQRLIFGSSMHEIFMTTALVFDSLVA